MAYTGNVGISGDLGIKVHHAPKVVPWKYKLKNQARPAFILGWAQRQLALWTAKLTRLPVMLGSVRAVLVKSGGQRLDLGVLGYRVVTTAFVNFMVDQLQTETSTWGDFKYHDSGTGTTAEAVGDTDIETGDGLARATGTQTEGASANIYRSVGTLSYTGSAAITEHGLLNASTSGTLLDRTVFSAINVSNGDSIEFTYELTVSAGS